MNDKELTEAIVCGLNTLSDPEIKISAKDIEVLANFKSILRGLLSGNLVLASPDRIIPKEVELPEEEKPQE